MQSWYWEQGCDLGWFILLSGKTVRIQGGKTGLIDLEMKKTYINVFFPTIKGLKHEEKTKPDSSDSYSMIQQSRK